MKRFLFVGFLVVVILVTPWALGAAKDLNKSHMPLILGGPAQAPYCAFVNWTDTGFKLQCNTGNQSPETMHGTGHMELNWIGITAQVDGCMPWGTCASYDSHPSNMKWTYDPWTGISEFDLGYPVLVAKSGPGWINVETGNMGTINVLVCPPTNSDCQNTIKVRDGGSIHNQEPVQSAYPYP